MPPAQQRRAVVTGIGVVAPNGVGVEPWWEATREGKSGIKRINRFDPAKYDTRVAGQVDGFNALDFLDQRVIAQTDRQTWMALAAAQLAMEDAGFEPSSHHPHRMSAILACSSGGNEFAQRELQNLWEKAPIFVGAYQATAWFYGAAAAQIAIAHGIKGPCSVVSAGGAGGLEALSLARRTLRRDVDVAFSGGTEAPLSPFALTCQIQSGNLSQGADPASYRPFDRRANGYIPGEGSAILLVEALEHAEQRGAPHVYGEIIGYAATSDAYHHARPSPDARQFSRAISLALQSAGIGPGEIDVVFADAAGTPQGDALEIRAIKEVFGGDSSRVPVTAPKTMTGRLSAGGGPLDVAAALLAMRDSCIPPTINLEQPARGCDLNLVRNTAQDIRVKTALINARGVGGFNSALVLRALTPH